MYTYHRRWCSFVAFCKSYQLAWDNVSYRILICIYIRIRYDTSSQPTWYDLQKAMKLLYLLWYVYMEYCRNILICIHMFVFAKRCTSDVPSIFVPSTADSRGHDIDFLVFALFLIRGWSTSLHTVVMLSDIPFKTENSTRDRPTPCWGSEPFWDPMKT